ncbi:MAG: DUF4153 domain-containing protein [Alistipes sp.]|nr:DUF4153 domain-containing protein [Alistipes sp.]
MIDFEHYFRMFREGMMQAVRRYPVELALALGACVLWLISYEADWSRGAALAAVVPLFFTLALAINRLAGEGPWRRIYWVSWMPLVPLCVWSGLKEWVASMPYVVSLCLLAPLALLLCRRAARNERFVSDALVWMRSLLLAELFANVALGLFAAILFSTTYIFGLSGKWIEHVWAWAAILCESLVAPSLFLMMAERWREATIVGNRLLQVLLDYIVTPALLIYTAILYLYALKIVATWTLPEGGVAYLVFGFTIVALAVKALQQVLERRRYDRFFDRFSVVSLPLLVLFWVGAARRIGQYGLTEPRVWLVVCGGVMTLGVLLFLFPRSARYRWVCALAFAVFALAAYVPALRPERIAVRSQLHRALRVAERLELLDADGTLRLDRFGADTTLKADYRRFYEAVEYVSWRDTTAFQRFGVSREKLRKAVPASIHDYVIYGWEEAVDTVEIAEAESVTLDRAAQRVAVAGYTTLYPDWNRYWQEMSADDYTYRFRDDTLRLHFDGRTPDWAIAAPALLTAQLRSAGLGDAVPGEKEVQQAAEKLLVYRDGERMILFRKIEFERSDSTLRISGLAVDAVLTR